MEWTFLAVVLVVVVTPGADLLMVLRSTVAGGRKPGVATAIGICAASVLQGTLVALGVGAVIVNNQLLFETIRWLGVAFLVYLGGSSLVRSLRRSKATGSVEPVPEPSRSSAGRTLTTSLFLGFTTNITNPKMFVFYLSLLPQFLGPSASLTSWLLHAWALPLIGTTWLLIVAVVAARVRGWLLKPLVRRVTDAVAGVALLGFGARLAVEH